MSDADTLESLQATREELAITKSDIITLGNESRQLETKAFDAGFKAIQESTGEFSAVVSVFNNADLYGDVVREGAYTKDLANYKSASSPNLDPLPIVFAHQSRTLDGFVGQWDDAKELSPGDPLLPSKLRELGGLWLKGRLDIDEDPYAAKLYRQLKGGRIKQFSFQYRVIRYAWMEFEGKRLRELLELEIKEAGPCLSGVNPQTELVDIKSLASNGVPTNGGPDSTFDPSTLLTLLDLNDL